MRIMETVCVCVCGILLTQTCTHTHSPQQFTPSMNTSRMARAAVVNSSSECVYITDDKITHGPMGHVYDSWVWKPENLVKQARWHVGMRVFEYSVRTITLA